MAQIPQINNPITAKNYNYSSRPMDPNTEPFDIVKLTGVRVRGTPHHRGRAAALRWAIVSLSRYRCRSRRIPPLRWRL